MCTKTNWVKSFIIVWPSTKLLICSRSASKPPKQEKVQDPTHILPFLFSGAGATGVIASTAS